MGSYTGAGKLDMVLKVLCPSLLTGSADRHTCLYTFNPFEVPKGRLPKHQDSRHWWRTLSTKVQSTSQPRVPLS